MTKRNIPKETKKLLSIPFKKKMLIIQVQTLLPNLKKMANSDADVVVLHQDAFATGYQETEYHLLGMAIKYLGIKGKEVRIVGKNRETLSVKKQ